MCQLHEEITRDRKTQCLHRFVKEQTAGLPPQNSTITAVLRFVLRSVCKPLKFIGTTTLSIRRVPKTTASPSSSFFSKLFSFASWHLSRSVVECVLAPCQKTFHNTTLVYLSTYTSTYHPSPVIFAFLPFKYMAVRKLRMC